VDHQTALWGTKCNKLLLMNLPHAHIHTHTRALAPLPQAWVDHQTALWGTKCNKLLFMNLHNHQTTQLHQPKVPEECSRPVDRSHTYGRYVCLCIYIPHRYGLHACVYIPQKYGLCARLFMSECDCECVRTCCCLFSSVHTCLKIRLCCDEQRASIGRCLIACECMYVCERAAPRMF
jgi:hypothetical protein